MVEHELHIGEHREGHTFGIVFGNDWTSVLHAVIAADGSVLLLLRIEEVDHVERGICLVAVVQKESCKARIEEVDRLLVIIGNVVAGKAVLFRSLSPAFVNPDP